MNYAITLAASAALSCGWTCLRAKKRGMKTAPVFTGFLLGAVLAAVCAKALYVALMAYAVWPRFGIGVFLRLEAAEFSFVGGCLGMALGMMLGARIHRTAIAPMLSLFAPAGAFLAAGARVGELFLDMLGVGSYVEVEALARAPFAVSNMWGEWFWSIFLLEALCALAVSAVFALRKKEDGIPGLRFERTVYYLCVPQILCESLRTMGIRWGFVRAEQVLCAAVILGLLIYGCLKAGQGSFWKRFWPVLAALACIAVDIGVEFGLDKTNLPPWFWYAVMIATLVGFGALENIVTQRRFRQIEGHS